MQLRYVAAKSIRSTSARVVKSASPIPCAFPSDASDSRSAMIRSACGTSGSARPAMRHRPMTFTSMPVPL